MGEEEEEAEGEAAVEEEAAGEGQEAERPQVPGEGAPCCLAAAPSSSGSPPGASGLWRGRDGKRGEGRGFRQLRQSEASIFCCYAAIMFLSPLRPIACWESADSTCCFQPLRV